MCMRGQIRVSFFVVNRSPPGICVSGDDDLVFRFRPHRGGIAVLSRCYVDIWDCSPGTEPRQPAQPSASVLCPIPKQSKHLLASATTSPSPSSSPAGVAASSLSPGTSRSAILLMASTISSASAIQSTSFLSPDSSSCRSVQIAMCWKVGSPLATKRLR